MPMKIEARPAGDNQAGWNAAITALEEAIEATRIAVHVVQMNVLTAANYEGAGDKVRMLDQQQVSAPIWRLFDHLRDVQMAVDNARTDNA